MASRKISDLDPRLQPIAEKFAAAMAEAGVPFIFTRTRCTQAEQDELYAQGRTKPGRKVTWTRKSKHIDGLAFDIAICKAGIPSWDVKVDVDKDGVPDYLEAAAIGEKLGLVSGARWKKTPDYPHFEWKA
jgi:peptidoglycan L-alanyl-D-glutamate endopeptidase CwlK